MVTNNNVNANTNTILTLLITNTANAHLLDTPPGRAPSSLGFSNHLFFNKQGKWFQVLLQHFEKSPLKTPEISERSTFSGQHKLQPWLLGFAGPPLSSVTTSSSFSPSLKVP